MKRKSNRRTKPKNSGGIVKRRSADYSSLSLREKDAYARSIDLVYDLRNGDGPYSRLLRKHRLDSRTVRRHAGRYLLGGKRGRRVRASKTDMLVRELKFPTGWGDVPRLVRGSKAASKLSDYYNDRDKLLNNEFSPAEFEAKWRGERIARRELFAHADRILQMEEADVLNIEDLYASVGSAE
jgi:hypothetical protein